MPSRATALSRVAKDLPQAGTWGEYVPPLTTASACRLSLGAAGCRVLQPVAVQVYRELREDVPQPASLCQREGRERREGPLRKRHPVDIYQALPRLL